VTYLLSFEIRVDGELRRSVMTDERNVTIGRSAGAVIQADDAALDDLHSVVLQQDDGTMVLLSYSDLQPTLLNGEPARSAHVSEGDVIQCGNTTVTLLERRAAARRGGLGGDRWFPNLFRTMRRRLTR